MSPILTAAMLVAAAAATHTLTVTAYDLAGNEGKSEEDAAGKDGCPLGRSLPPPIGFQTGAGEQEDLRCS